MGRVSRDEDDDAPADGEPDRAAILRRRAVFIASALAGASMVGCGDPATTGAPSGASAGSAVTQSSGPSPLPCLTVEMPRDPPPDAGPGDVDAGTEDAGPGDAGLGDAGADAGAGDAGKPPPEKPRPPPHPCLSVVRPQPAPCLNVARPDACLSVTPPEE